MQKYIKYISVTLFILIVLISFGFGAYRYQNLLFEDVTISSNTQSSQSNVLSDESQNTVDGKFLLSEIDASDILQGCRVRDCIPSIDNPNFASVEESDLWLDDDDLIFGLNYNGVVKAYPQRILNWHEIVNDDFNGEAIAITFCPLCGSAGGFKREVNGQEVNFKVSGKLLNSNLIMYDDVEDSYWQQATGQAIAGEAAKRGDILEFIPIQALKWSDWRVEFPQSEVLTRLTGFSRDYDLYPYSTYEEDDQLYFGVQNTDDRLQLKTPGWGFEFTENDKKFNLFIEEKKLDNINEIQTDFGTIFNDKDGVRIVTQEGQEIASLRTFWFAFAAFFPDTIIL